MTGGSVPVMWWWMATTSMPFARSDLSTGVTSLVEHRDVAGDHRIGIAAVERRPCVESHARVDRGAHLLQRDVRRPIVIL